MDLPSVLDKKLLSLYRTILTGQIILKMLLDHLSAKVKALRLTLELAESGYGIFLWGLFLEVVREIYDIHG